MIVVRFKVKFKADKAEELHAAFAAIVVPSRMVDGVLNFDIARGITDPNAFIATEVFIDREALERQGLQPEEIVTALRMIEKFAGEAER